MTDNNRHKDGLEPIGDEIVHFFDSRLEGTADEHGLDDPATAQALSYSAMVHAMNDDWETAESLHRQALAIREKLLGPSHPDVAESLVQISFLAGLQGRLEEASCLCERALRIRAETTGRDTIEYAKALQKFAHIKRKAGFADESERMLEMALEVIERAEGPTSYELAESTFWFCSLLVKTGRYEKAEPFLKRLVETIGAPYIEQGSIETADYLTCYAIALENLGREQEAALYRSRAQAIMADVETGDDEESSQEETIN